MSTAIDAPVWYATAPGFPDIIVTAWHPDRRGARFFTLGCTKPMAVIERWPGACEALECRKRYREWDRAGRPDTWIPDDPAKFHKDVVSEVSAALARLAQPRG
jgi:hypothetical protein